MIRDFTTEEVKDKAGVYAIVSLITGDIYVGRTH